MDHRDYQRVDELILRALLTDPPLYELVPNDTTFEDRFPRDPDGHRSRRRFEILEPQIRKAGQFVSFTFTQAPKGFRATRVEAA